MKMNGSYYNGYFSIQFPVRGLTEYRTLIYWTAIADPIGSSVPALQCVTLGGKSAVFGQLFGHSAAENWSWHLIKKATRDMWAIFPTRYRSFDGARFCPETRDKFREKTRLARGTRWGGGSKASTTK